MFRNNIILFTQIQLLSFVLSIKYLNSKRFLLNSSTDPGLVQEKLLHLSNTINELINATQYENVQKNGNPITIAEKVYNLPMKRSLKNFLIDMAVVMKYNNESSLKELLPANASVSATLIPTATHIISENRKKQRNGHFEYSSPMLKVKPESLPVGLELFVPLLSRNIDSELDKNEEN